MTDEDSNAELKRLKASFLETEQIHQEERDCLLKVINTFGTVVAMREEMGDELRTIKALVGTDQSLPHDLIEAELGKLKDKIIAIETESPPTRDDLEEVLELKARLIASYRLMRKIMDALTEDFYPLSAEMAAEARVIDVNCRDDLGEAEMENAATAFLTFIEKLRIRILEDFRSINNAFLLLLDQIKELESTLTREFVGEDHIKEIEYFEMKVHAEMGSIADSFNIHRTIDEIKSTVTEKIENIKRLVSLKKIDEVRKAKSARKDIEQLKQKIAQAEKSMLEMGKKAAQFRKAAERDGLTALYNRKTFDRRLREAMEAHNQRDAAFSLIIFDVDRFKAINDTFGHVAGDKVLQKVAQCLAQAFRKDDFIARYGGDEFVILIKNLTREMALERILKFRDNLKRIRFTSHAKGDIHVTVSAGIALSVDGDTPECLIERADTALYESKQKKR